MKKVKTAIVGCGMISHIYIRNLKNMFSIIDLVALCNRSPAAAEEKAKLYGIDRVMTLEEIAADPEIELVVNLTPPAAHHEVIKTMLLAGKHVFTEKMMTVTLESARELVALAEEKGLYLGVAPDTVLSAGLQTARKLLDAGLIGTPTSVDVSVNRNQLLNSEMYRFLRGEGGCLPFDVGPYYIAAVLSLLGPVKAVRAFGAPAFSHQAELLYLNDPVQECRIPGNNVMVGALQFENGALGSVHFNGNTINQERASIRIFGTEGILEVGDPNRFDAFVKLIRQEGGECLMPHTHGYNGVPVLPDASPFDHYGHRGVGAAEMAYAIRQGRPNRCSKEYGLHCMEVLCGMDIAAETGETFYPMSRFTMKPLKSGYYSTMGGQRGDAELSLID